MDFASVWRAWSLPTPLTVRPLSNGSNNSVWLIATSHDRSYIVKSYPLEAVKRLGYEIELLKKLNCAKLPFSVPLQIPTVKGENWLSLQEKYSSGLITVWPLIKGVQPDPLNLTQTYAAGQALAELMQALEKITIVGSPEIIATPSYRDLQAWLPDGFNLTTFLAQLPIEEVNRASLLKLIEETSQAIPHLYSSLAQQIIHRDYDPSNVLVQENRITGVLDFEFSSYDIQTLDFVGGLSGWLSKQDTQWRVLEAFTRGYVSRLPLEVDAIEAIPRLLKLRAIVALFHRFQHYEQGEGTKEGIVNRIRSTLNWNSWINHNSSKLIQKLHIWQPQEAD